MRCILPAARPHDKLILNASAKNSLNAGASCGKKDARMARRKRDAFRKKKSWFGKGTKGRKILVGLLMTLVALVLLAVLGFYQLLGWLQGDAFRAYLSESVCNSAQAESVDIPQNLTIEGNRLSLPAFSMQRNGILNEVSAKRISSEVDRSALWDRHLRLNKVTVEDLSISMDLARADEALPEVEEDDDSFWSGFTPATYSVQEFECKDTDVNLLAGGGRYGLSGISVTAAPRGKDPDAPWLVNFENGRLRVPPYVYFLQECSVKTATLEIRPVGDGGGVLVALLDCCVQLSQQRDASSSGRFKSTGELKVKGSFNTVDKHWSITSLQVNKANVGRILLGDWKKKITGELFGKLTMSGTGDSITEASGTLQLSNGVLEGLPILSELELGNTKPFRTIALQEARCRVSFPYSEPSHNIYNAWLFDEIDIRSKDDTLRMTGRVIIGQDKSLGGTLCIGIAKTFLQENGLLGNEILAQLFTGHGDEAYCWVNLNLSGTLDNPGEDLSARISALTRQALPEMAGKALRATGGALLNLIPGFGGSRPAPQQPAPPAPEAGEPATPAGDRLEQAGDAAGEILDQAGSAAEGIINTGLNIFF